MTPIFSSTPFKPKRPCSPRTGPLRTRAGEPSSTGPKRSAANWACELQRGGAARPLKDNVQRRRARVCGPAGPQEKNPTMQLRWIRFEHAGQISFGTLEGDRVHQRRGDMYGSSEPTGAVFPLNEVKLLTPSEPSKVVAMWNNFHALGAKLNLPVPLE